MQFTSLIEAQHRYRNMSIGPHVCSRFGGVARVVVLPELRESKRPKNSTQQLAEPKTESTESKTKSTTEAPTMPMTINQFAETINELTEDRAQDPQAEREIPVPNYDKAIRMLKTIESQQEH